MSRTLTKQIFRIILLGGLGIGLLAGCGDEDKPQSRSQPQVIDSPVGTGPSRGSAQLAPNNAQPSVVPVLTLAANSSLDTELVQGWPIIFEVSLVHPDYMNSSVVAQPLTVGEESSPWTGAVTLEAMDAEGKTQSWPLQVASAPESAVSLDNEATSTAYWTLGPDQTVELKEGDYAVTATLDTASFASGWQGAVRSASAVLHVRKAPEVLSEDEESLLAQRLAAQAVVVGDNAGAMSILDELLAKQPNSIGALEFKGNLLAEGGRTEDALQAYSQAIRAFYEKNENPEEPPTMLAHKQRDMMVKLLEK